MDKREDMKFSAELLGTLSPREREIYDLLVLGHSNKEIARKLSISWNTMRNQAHAIYKKLGVANRVDIILGHYGLPSWMDEKGEDKK